MKWACEVTQIDYMGNVGRKDVTLIEAATSEEAVRQLRLPGSTRSIVVNVYSCGTRPVGTYDVVKNTELVVMSR